MQVLLDLLQTLLEACLIRREDGLSDLFDVLLLDVCDLLFEVFVKDDTLFRPDHCLDEGVDEVEVDGVTQLGLTDLQDS